MFLISSSASSWASSLINLSFLHFSIDGLPAKNTHCYYSNHEENVHMIQFVNDDKIKTQILKVW